MAEPLPGLGYMKWIVGGIALVLIIIFFSPLVIVGAGRRGVVFNAATGVENRILGEGTHFRIPFLESVTTVSVQVQKTDVKAEAASKDLQTVNTDIVINWHLDVSQVNKVYQQIGDQDAVRDRIIIPATNEVVKAATAQLNVSQILEQRPKLKSDLDTLLSERLKKFGVLLDDVSIVNVNFSPEFNQAIEQKQVAQQEAERALFKVQEASAEAQANKLKQQSLTPDLLQQMAIQKWDGKLPQSVGGATPFINLSR